MKIAYIHANGGVNRRDYRFGSAAWESRRVITQKRPECRFSEVCMDKNDPPVEEALASLKNTLPTSVEVGGLIARNRTAHKWKVTFFTLYLREAVYWRLEDLLQQSF